MENTQPSDYKKIISEVLKKQIAILGPDLTLAKARNVTGLTVTNDGTVTDIKGNPQLITQNLVEEFVQLSGLIVTKTMEPLLFNSPDSSLKTVGISQLVNSGNSAPVKL